VVNDLAGAIDGTGKIVAWRHETWEPYRISPSAEVPMLAQELLTESPIYGDPSNPGTVEKNAAPGYAVPNIHAVINKTQTTFFRPSWLRGPGRLQNTWANESFMDEMAALSGIDPVELRLRHMTDQRGIAVLQAAVKKAGWKPRAANSKRKDSGDIATGRGVAYVQYDGDRTYVAAVADVTGVDWASYPLLRFPEVPKIDVVLIDQPGKPAWGAGEPTCAVVPSAVAGAVFDAVGVRLRSVPFRAPEVVAGIKA
jgi:nicotinate dehydrogenase subunit B